MRMDGGRPAPSSGWFVEERSTKPMKEIATAVGSVNVYLKKAAAEAAAGRKAAAEAAAARKAAAEAEGSKKRTVTIRLQQGYIDHLLKQYPVKPFPFYPAELEKNVKDPERREMLSQLLGPTMAVMKKLEDEDLDVIKQYYEKGYAELEIEVDDDDEEA